MKKIFISLIAIAVLVSCDMNKQPYSSISPDNALSSMLDASKLRNFIYANFRGLTSGGYVYSGEIQADLSVSEITGYYSMCERALVTDWCLNRGSYSLGEYSRKCMPIMLEHFKAN